MFGEIVHPLTIVLLGSLVLYLGGNWLIKSATVIARQFKISPWIIGLTLVAFGTSLPELLVSLYAVLHGSGDIAIGNVVGSNIANVGLVIGIVAMISPIVVYWHKYRQDIYIMIGLSVLFVLFALNGIQRWESVILLMLFIGYLYLLFSIRKDPPDLDIDINGDSEISWMDIIFDFVLGILFLHLGAKIFVGGAIWIAEILSVPEQIVGLTVVAIGTSLPELVTSLIAIKKGENDLSIGNVVGSNIFNILLVVGVVGTVSSKTIASVTWISLGLMIAMAVFLLLSMLGKDIIGRKINRFEGVGLFVIYCFFIFLMYK